jgi:hypothetical protein
MNDAVCDAAWALVHFDEIHFQHLLTTTALNESAAAATTANSATAAWAGDSGHARAHFPGALTGGSILPRRQGGLLSSTTTRTC